MKTLREAVGGRVKNRRENLQISQRELARKIGICHSVVSRLEKGGNTSYGLDDLEKFAIAFKCSVKDLVPDAVDGGYQ